MTTEQPSTFWRTLARWQPVEWAGLACCLPVGMAVVAVLSGMVAAPVSWAIWAVAGGLAAVMTLWALAGRRGSPELYACLCAVPATLLACVTGGLAGPGLLAVLWPVAFSVAAGLPLRAGLAASGSAALAASVIGWLSGPIATNSSELVASSMFGWAGLIGLALAGAYFGAGLSEPVLAVRRERDARLRAEAEARAAEQAAATARADSAGKARFMAEMSHEIRNPLNAILGFSETMRDNVMGPMPAPYQDYPRLIHDSGRLLLDLVSDLLDLSKIEAGRFSVNSDPVRLDDVARDAVEMMAGAAKQAGVRLRLVAGGPLTAQGDMRALRQSMLNLVSNAIKFTPAGGQIVVGASLSGDATMALLEVRDTGEGMDAARLQQATDLYSSSGDQPRGARGTGLGLALVKQLSELQGGSLALFSAPGEGTLAQIRLKPVQNP
jgi:signal transduction histidine kinase